MRPLATVGVAGTYGLTQFLLSANFARLRPADVWVGSSAASVAALTALQSHGFFNDAMRYSLAMRLGVYVSLAVAGRTDLNGVEWLTRWDAAAAALGASLVVAAVVRNLLPGSTGVRWAYELAVMVVLFPLLGVLPRLFDIPKVDRANLLAAAELCAQVWTADDKATVVDKATDTHVLVLPRLVGGKMRLAIAFRGTKSGTQLKFDMQVGSRSIKPWLSQAMRDAVRGVDVRVHEGFAKSFESVRSRVHELVRASDLPVLVVGHSLGGALAVLAATSLRAEFPGREIAVYTLGAPPVGDGLFVQLFNASIKESVRVVNPTDPIPRSVSFQFAHVKGYYPINTIKRDTHSQHTLPTYVDGLKASAASTVGGMLLPVGVAAIAIIPVIGLDWYLRKRRG